MGQRERPYPFGLGEWVRRLGSSESDEPGQLDYGIEQPQIISANKILNSIISIIHYIISRVVINKTHCVSSYQNNTKVLLIDFIHFRYPSSSISMRIPFSPVKPFKITKKKLQISFNSPKIQALFSGGLHQRKLYRIMNLDLLIIP